MDLGYFKLMRFLFLIVRHKNNSADRFFNLMKSNYRKICIHIGPVMQYLGIQTCLCFVWEVFRFYGYAGMLRSFYCKLKWVKYDHIFKSFVNSEGHLWFQSKEANVEEEDTMSYSPIKKNSMDDISMPMESRVMMRLSKQDHF